MSGSFASSGLFSLNMSETTEKAVDVSIDPMASYGCKSCDSHVRWYSEVTGLQSACVLTSVVSILPGHSVVPHRVMPSIS